MVSVNRVRLPSQNSFSHKFCAKSGPLFKYLCMISDNVLMIGLLGETSPGGALSEKSLGFSHTEALLCVL